MNIFIIFCNVQNQLLDAKDELTDLMKIQAKVIYELIEQVCKALYLYLIHD
jgi:hypothetical protein